MSRGDYTEALAAVTISIAIFIIFSAVFSALVGLGSGLLVSGVYLLYVAQFVDVPKE